MKYAAMALLVIAASCAPLDLPESTHTYRVTIVKTDNAHSICQKMLGVSNAEYLKSPIRACYRRDGAMSCTIWITHNDMTWNQEVLGHELKHCVEGNFH